MDKMKDLAYYNGKITAIDDMMIPANDRGFYFGRWNLRGCNGI